MFIIVGLGNLGKQFEDTRHNAGFMAVDLFAKKNEFPPFELAKKYEAKVSEKDDVILVKPQTFMNESGKTIDGIMHHSKYTAQDVVVVHDDIDLPLGTIKFSKDSGSGGHKGVDSIIRHLGNNQFVRLKIGIATGDEKAEDVVLKKFLPGQKKILEKALATSAEALSYLVAYGIEKTMNCYNGKN